MYVYTYVYTYIHTYAYMHTYVGARAGAKMHHDGLCFTSVSLVRAYEHTREHLISDARSPTDLQTHRTVSRRYNDWLLGLWQLTVDWLKIIVLWQQTKIVENYYHFLLVYDSKPCIVCRLRTVSPWNMSTRFGMSSDLICNKQHSWAFSYLNPGL